MLNIGEISTAVVALDFDLRRRHICDSLNKYNKSKDCCVVVVVAVVVVVVVVVVGCMRPICVGPK
jgi:hypothetical protein